MASLVQPQMVDIDAVLAVHALQPEQPPPQPVDNVAAPVNAAPGETNAAPAQLQVRFLSCAQCNVIRSPVVWVHDVCILVYCPDIPSLFPCLLKFPLFPLYYNEFGSYIWLIAWLQLSFLSCFCLSRGANLVRLIHCLRTEFSCSEACGTLGLAAALVISITFLSQCKDM